MIDLSTPEGFARGWSRVLSRFPGAKPMPRIDVVTRALGRERILGQFDPRRYVITLFDDGDRDELLHTLIHEMAHAWSPLERLHHGPHWQQCYAAITSWLFEHELELSRVRRVALENGWHELIDDDGRKCGRGASLMMFALDVALSSEIDRRRPTLTLNTDGINVEIQATLSNPERKIWVPVQETSCRERNSRTARKSASR